ncbi:MAG: hypothetical protein U1C33_03885, partial [Candidatus Cloacimonadaceae bacterium]|nr:hypothetical protein [Candidatus Cloacimonadaceae bacterium]
FDRVVVKVMPYISAREGQLISGKTSSNINGTRVRYQQIVNGYRIEGAGFLNVAYNFDTKKITVTDATVDIAPQQVPINITEDQAIDIVLQRYKADSNFDKDHWMFRRHVRLVYAPIEHESGMVDFRLCYLISFGGGTNYVDPTTGEIVFVRKIWIANDD